METTKHFIPNVFRSNQVLISKLMVLVQLVFTVLTKGTSVLEPVAQYWYNTTHFDFLLFYLMISGNTKLV